MDDAQLTLNDLDTKVKSPLSNWYGDKIVEEAIDNLQCFYLDQQFDDEDFTDDWIPNDFENCDGIDVFVESLNYKPLINHETNKRILFNWFCYWLLPNIPAPELKPPFPTINAINKVNTNKNETKEEEKLQVIHRYHMCDTQESQIKQLKQKIYTISNHIAATVIIDCIDHPQDGFEELDDILDDTSDKDTSVIFAALKENPNIDDIDNIFDEIYQIICNMLKPEPSELLKQKIEMVDNETGDAYNHDVYRQDRLSEICNLSMLSVGSCDPEYLSHYQSLWKPVVKLRCIFGVNAPLQMIELQQRQLIRAFNYDYDAFIKHLEFTQTSKHQMLLHNFFVDKCIKFKLENKYRQKWNEWILGLRMYDHSKSKGSAAFKGWVYDHLKFNIQDAPYEDESSDEDYNEYISHMHDLNLDHRFIDFIHYPVLPIQVYIMAFYIALTKQLLTLTTNINYSTALLINIPYLADSETDLISSCIIKGSVKKMIHELVAKFEYSLKEDQQFSNKMDAHNIALWNVKFLKHWSDSGRIKSPEYISTSERNIGFQLKAGDFDTYFKDFQNFEIHRIKRVFMHKCPYRYGSGSKSIGIGLHKFEQTIKMYLHYQQAHIRIDIEDIVNWVRRVFSPNPLYHEHEINSSNWSSISVYLQQMIKESLIKKYGHDCVKSGIDIHSKIWKVLDKEFNDLDEMLRQEIVKSFPQLDALSTLQI